MLHCPSLAVFQIKEIFEEEIQDRNQFFYMLKSWRRLQSMFPNSFVPIETIFNGSQKGQIMLAFEVSEFISLSEFLSFFRIINK